jgi:hypothetical protein
MQKIVLPENLQKEMMKFFLRTSISRKKAAANQNSKGGKKHE